MINATLRLQKIEYDRWDILDKRHKIKLLEKRKQEIDRSIERHQDNIKKIEKEIRRLKK